MSSVDKVALDYFDASINRISAWVVGFRNFQKALLNALLTPNETLKQLQDEGRMSVGGKSRECIGYKICTGIYPYV